MKQNGNAALIHDAVGERTEQLSFFDNQGSTTKSQRTPTGSEAWLFENQLLTLDELCTWLQVKKHRVYAWTSMNAIPFQKVGGSLRFDRKAVWRWLQKK